MHTADSESSPLNYESADLSRRGRRRRRVRLAVGVGLAAVCVVLGLHFGPKQWVRLKMWYSVRQCANYTAPADMVVFSNDPNSVGVLGARPHYSIEKREVDPPCVLFHPPCLSPLDPLAGSLQQATLFLHELRTTGRHRKLVAVMFEHGLKHSAGYDVFFIATAQMGRPDAPDGWHYPCEDPADLDLAELRGELSRGLATGLTFYAGQVDAADPSRFSIRARWNSTEHFIDGRLEDAPGGPVVRLKLRPSQAPPSLTHAP